MKLLKGILITAILYGVSIFSDFSVATAQMGWPGHMGGPGHMGYSGYSNGNFKVADLDLDGVNEIIMLEGSILVVMDNKGNLLFTKTVNLKGYYPWESSYNLVDGDGHHGGPMHGGDPGDDSDDNDDNDTNNDNNEDVYNDDYYYHMGSGGFDVANLDDDKNPEIIIMDYNSLLVLDNNGNKKYTIELPLIVNP